MREKIELKCPKCDSWAITGILIVGLFIGWCGFSAFDVYASEQPQIYVVK